MASDEMPNLGALAQRNLALLESGDYHDFVLIAEGKEFKVHRSIVCPQSPMLEALCSNVWKEGTEKRATLQGQHADTLEKALRFIYIGKYDDGQELTPDALDFAKEDTEELKHALLFNTRMYILADYLDVKDLGSSSCERLLHLLDAVHDMTTLIEAFDLALTSTPSSDTALRPAILRFCGDNASFVQACPELEAVLLRAEAIAWTLQVQAARRFEKLHQQIQSIQSEQATLVNSRNAYKRSFEMAFGAMSGTYICSRCKWGEGNFRIRTNPRGVVCPNCGFMDQLPL